MTIDHRLLDLLVCPLCKGPLTAARDEASRVVELQCAADRLGFPVRDGMPVMLEAEARPLDGQEASSATPAAPAA
jgi:uncharacterized protein YbaR (Trm112 family)